MTDQSRVEAVVAAATKKVVALKCGEAFCFITDEQWDEILQAAIEANDAWLKVRGQELLVEQVINMAAEFHATPEDTDR